MTANKNLYFSGIILLIVIFSLIFPGYKTLTSDQEIYLPQIINLNDEVLQENDFLYSFNQINFTVFDEFLAFFTDTLNINIFIVLFLLTLITRFIYFYSIYKIAFYFTKNRIFSLLSPLIFISGLTVFGTALTTIDIELHPRTISFALMLLFLAAYLDNKKYLSAIILGIGTLFHPISAIPFLIFFYLDLGIIFIKDKSIKLSKLLALFVIPAIITSILLLFIDFGSDSGIFALIDPAWKHIIDFRDNYIFLTSWPKKEFSHFIIVGVFFLVCVLELKDIIKGAKKKYFYLLLMIPLTLSVIFFVLTEFFNVFASFQLYRSLILWKIILPLLFSFYVFRKVTREKPDYIFSFVLFAILFSMILKELAIMVFLPVFLIIWLKKYLPNILTFLNQKAVLLTFQTLLITGYFYYLIKTENTGLIEFVFIFLFAVSAVLLAIYFKKKKLYYAIPFIIILALFIVFLGNPVYKIKPVVSYDIDFQELCTWISTNTDKDEQFITEPFLKESAEIRALCERPVYFSSRDGAQVVFNRDYAIEWDRRRNMLKNIDKKDLKSLALNENVKYLISTKDVVSLNNDIIFDNNKYIIYKIN